ncbi:MAG: ATP synthase F0 subunit B [Lawsonibacter sp.]
MLDFQLSTVIFTVLNLLILYVVLRKLLFGRVNRILEERAALVEKELSSAERQKAQAEEMRKEYGGPARPGPCPGGQDRGSGQGAGRAGVLQAILDQPRRIPAGCRSRPRPRTGPTGEKLDAQRPAGGGPARPCWRRPR